jgi:D-3-phosphoglycerate dehydrogenase
LAWTRKENIGTELGGKTIGIIGYGNTGNAFARRIKAFDVDILAYDKYKTGFSDSYVKESDMKGIFNHTDVLSFHIPLTAETRYLANTEYFSHFRKNIYLINTSRGGILKTSDLVQAIHQEKILGAALDVFENENFRTLSVKEKSDLTELINSGKVIFTPHIAGLTFESENRIFRILLEKLKTIDKQG